MNYENIYNKIIFKRQASTPLGYTESHHIKPRSLGGSDDRENLVELTAREHFICHLLLMKMQSIGSSSYYKMLRAFMAMLCWHSENQVRYISSRKYEKLKSAFAELQRKTQTGPGNSRHGTMWVTNPRLKISKTIPSEEQIEEGWIRGRSFYKEVPEKISKTQELYDKNKARANELFRTFKGGGYSSLRDFCRSGHYDKSVVSLSNMWKKYVPEFSGSVKHGKRFSFS